MQCASRLGHSCVPHTREAALNTSLPTLYLLVLSLAYVTPTNVVSSLSLRLSGTRLGPYTLFPLGMFWNIPGSSTMLWNMLEHPRTFCPLLL